MQANSGGFEICHNSVLKVASVKLRLQQVTLTQIFHSLIALVSFSHIYNVDVCRVLQVLVFTLRHSKRGVNGSVYALEYLYGLVKRRSF